jgi:hypothetical protein
VPREIAFQLFAVSKELVGNGRKEDAYWHGAAAAWSNVAILPRFRRHDTRMRSAVRDTRAMAPAHSCGRHADAKHGARRGFVRSRALKLGRGGRARRPADEVEVGRSGHTNRKTLWGDWPQQFLPENRMACYKSFDGSLVAARERGKEAMRRDSGRGLA